VISEIVERPARLGQIMQQQQMLEMVMMRTRCSSTEGTARYNELQRQWSALALEYDVLYRQWSADLMAAYTRGAK
jgi:hypothetical protein